MCCRGRDNNTNQGHRREEPKEQETSKKAGARWLRKSNAEHTRQAFRLSAWNHINQTEGSYVLTRKALNSGYARVSLSICSVYVLKRRPLGCGWLILSGGQYCGQTRKNYYGKLLREM